MSASALRVFHPRLAAMLAFLLLSLHALPAAAGACEDLLVGMSSSGTTVTAATTIPGPSYTAPDGVTYTNVPSFCKVSVVLTPTSDSFINVELWMPTSTWNGRFEGVGNGGYAGTIALGVPAMIAGLQTGFAVATTDMGTAPSSNNDGDALIGHPEKWIDFGWRATHLMTTTSKQVMQSYYGQPPRYSYFNGCSTGGEQAQMEAQRFPADYNGILGGDPANNRTHAHTGILSNYRAMHATAASLFTSTQAQAVTNSIVAACGVASGGLATDPFLTDPRTCHWDPGVLQCTGVDTGSCLTPDQVQAARTMYAGPHDPVTGHLIFPGSVRGSESDGQFGWTGIGGQPETPFGSIFKWVFGGTFVYSDFNFDTDMATMDQLLAPNLNANSTDLSTFASAGGKFIMYHGWADPLVSPQESINYYERLVASQGNNGTAAVRQTQSFYRLFMVPGMYHCAFGPGPNAFGNRFSGQVYAAAPSANDAQHDIFVALQQWVEQGVAPSRVIATKYVNDVPNLGVQMTRPLCVYPQVAKYSGAGDPNDASNFVCAPAPGSTDPSQVPASEYVN